MEIKEKIVVAAGELFMRLGIRSVTMDDVGREISVSKKTLYQFFENKDNLVTAVAQRYLEIEMKDFGEISVNAENAIHEIHLLSRCLRNHILRTNPSTLHDIKKYHQNAWNHFLSFKNSFIKEQVKNNIIRGIEEGYYRSDLDPEILAVFRVEQVQMIFDNKIFPMDQFDFTSVQMHLFEHFIHGLFTEKGKELYQQFREVEVKSVHQ